MSDPPHSLLSRLPGPQLVCPVSRPVETPPGALGQWLVREHPKPLLDGARAPLGACVELGGQRRDTTRDVVADPAHLLEGKPLGVLEIPVDVALAGDVGTLVAAPHRD